jgi:hypothetical protein
MIYIYGTRACAFCDKAKEHAAKHYGGYKEKGIGMSVQPQIFEDERLIGTYYHLIKETQYRMEQQ